jgi:hypothetical protein
VDRPELQVGPDYPTVRHVTNVCVALASQLADLWLASYFQRRRALWNTLEAILRTYRRSLLAFNKFKDSYVYPLEQEFVDNVVVALPDSEFNLVDSSLRGPARRDAARARFVTRVAHARQTREEWWRDPAALWQELKIKFGTASEEVFQRRMSNFHKGFPLKGNQTIKAWFDAFEAEVEGLELERPGCTGTAVSRLVPVRDSLRTN